jgi:hypothetical protein
MKLAAAVLGGILACPVLLAAEETTISITETTTAGSPVQNTGSVTLSETAIDEKRAVMSHGDDWTVKNVSQKPIVAFVETLLVRDANGVSVERKAQYDAFFHPELVAPGATISLSEESQGKRVIIAKFIPPPVSPTCEVTVRWVQYADGSTFGDSKYAEQLLQDRVAIRGILEHLKDVYTNEGPEKFDEQLQERFHPPDADGYIEHIRIVRRNRGAQKAIDTVTLHLNVAQQRALLYQAER